MVEGTSKNSSDLGLGYYRDPHQPPPPPAGGAAEGRGLKRPASLHDAGASEKTARTAASPSAPGTQSSGQGPPHPAAGNYAYGGHQYGGQQYGYGAQQDRGSYSGASLAPSPRPPKASQASNSH